MENMAPPKKNRKGYCTCCKRGHHFCQEPCIFEYHLEITWLRWSFCWIQPWCWLDVCMCFCSSSIVELRWCGNSTNDDTFLSFFLSDLNMWTASKPFDVGLSLWMSLSMKCVLCLVITSVLQVQAWHWYFFADKTHVDDFHSWEPTASFFQSIGRFGRSLSLFHLGSFCELPLYVLLDNFSIVGRWLPYGYGL